MRQGREPEGSPLVRILATPKYLPLGRKWGLSQKTPTLREIQTYLQKTSKWERNAAKTAG